MWGLNMNTNKIFFAKFLGKVILCKEEKLYGHKVYRDLRTGFLHSEPFIDEKIYFNDVVDNEKKHLSKRKILKLGEYY